MMLHNIAIQEQAIAADGVVQFDLPVNPLSVILLALRPLNDTGTLANFNFYRSVAAAMNRVSVVYRGEAIRSMRGEDLAAYNYFRHGIIPIQANPDNVDNERRCVVVPIIMGRFPYMKSSCFPETRRGELQLEIDFDIADTGYDGMRFSVETVELLGARPKEFEKIVAVNQTFAATGEVDVDLPCTGNGVRGILCFGTTGFGGAAPAPSWGRVRTLLDGSEVGYAGTDFEVAMTLGQLWGRQLPAFPHAHGVTVSGCAQTHVETISTFNQSSGDDNLASDSWLNYMFLDFDPTGDDEWTLQTKGKSKLQIRANAETADAVRAYPIEVIKL